MDSPVSTWAGTETGDKVDDNFFHFFAVDEVSSKFNSAGDLLQNETVFLLIQHDPKIRIDAIIPSTGTMQGVSNPKPVTRSQTQETVFYDNKPYQLQYIPKIGTVNGLWWLDPPTGTPFTGAGSPPKTIVGREITVDIESFGRPCPCHIDYDTVFKQVRWVPPRTDFLDSNVVWNVAFLINYSKVNTS